MNRNGPATDYFEAFDRPYLRQLFEHAWSATVKSYQMNPGALILNVAAPLIGAVAYVLVASPQGSTILEQAILAATFFVAGAIMLALATFMFRLFTAPAALTDQLLVAARGKVAALESRIGALDASLDSTRLFGLTIEGSGSVRSVDVGPAALQEWRARHRAKEIADFVSRGKKRAAYLMPADAMQREWATPADFERWLDENLSLVSMESALSAALALPAGELRLTLVNLTDRPVPRIRVRAHLPTWAHVGGRAADLTSGDRQILWEEVDIAPNEQIALRPAAMAVETGHGEEILVRWSITSQERTGMLQGEALIQILPNVLMPEELLGAWRPWERPHSAEVKA